MMKRLTFFLTLLLALPSLVAQNYQLYVRLTDPNGVIPGSVPTLNGVSGSNFFPVGCGEHQFGLPSGGAQANHQPYLLTRAFDPGSSPRVRQQMHLSGFWTVELFYMQDNGGSLTPFFGVRLENARLTQVTTAVASSSMQETLSFEYGRIYWIDLLSGQRRGWDLINNVAL